MSDDLKVICEVRKTKAKMKEQYSEDPKWWVVFYRTIGDEDFFVGGRYFKKQDLKNINEACEALSRAEIIDKTNNGYYCVQCGRFSTEPKMVLKNKEIYKKNDVWMLVNDHYDGCRGWD